MSEEFQQTTTFEAQGPGGTGFKISSRNMQIFIWLGLAIVLGYGAAIIWSQRIQLDLIVLVQREILRQVREIKCTLYLSEADRKAYPSVVAACKATGEVQ